jgi:hypothetical protein
MEKMMNCEFKVEKFNGKSKYELWKLKMRYLLVQQGLHKALYDKWKKPATMIDEVWEDLDARALRTIRLYLVNAILFNII